MHPRAFAAYVATVLALVSAWHSGRHVWHRIQDDRRVYSAYTPTDRENAPAVAVGLDGDIFAWYAQYVGAGDRFYVQVPADHDPRLVRILAGYELLPGVEVDRPSQATVIVSYYADPDALGLHYLTEEQAGAQPLFVSRVSAP